MQIKGIQKTTLIDYPNKVAATIFVGKCNFKCPFCYNADLVLFPEEIDSIPEQEILDFLKKRKKWLDGVCISGGEPTVHKKLPNFLKKIKELGYLIKLDTNGYNPDMIKQLIDKKLVDYIAMDIKTSLENYDKAAGVKVNKEVIKKAVELIKKSDVEYEFRITAVPNLFNKDDAESIGKWLKDAKLFVIQNFKPSGKLIDESYSNKQPFSKKQLEKFKKILKKYFEKVEIRNVKNH